VAAPQQGQARRVPAASCQPGLIYDQSGNVTFDPGWQIRETFVHFFDTFSRAGSACQIVKPFAWKAFCFPHDCVTARERLFGR
jgi:hypothetical protein